MRAPGRVFAGLVTLALGLTPALASADRVHTGTTHTRFLSAGASAPCGSDGDAPVVSFDPGVLDETLSGSVTCGAVHAEASTAHVSLIGLGGFVEAAGTLHAEATAPSPTLFNTNVENLVQTSIVVHEHVSVRIRVSASASATATPAPQGSPPFFEAVMYCSFQSRPVFFTELRPLVNGPTESIEIDDLVLLSPGDCSFSVDASASVGGLPLVTNTAEHITYEVELRAGPDLPSLSPPGLAALAALLLASGASVCRRVG